MPDRQPSDPATVRARERRRRRKASEEKKRKTQRDTLSGTSNQNLRRLLIEFLDEDERQAAGG